MGVPGERAAWTLTVIVRPVTPLESRKRRSISPFVLLPGTPPVVTTETVPPVTPVTLSSSLVLTGSGLVPPVTRFLTVVVPV